MHVTTHRVMYANQLSGTIPSSLGQLSYVTELYAVCLSPLYNSGIYGPICWVVQFPLHLLICHLLINCVFQLFVKHLSNHRYLSSNQLNGTIPSELGQLTYLNELCFPFVYRLFYHTQGSICQPIEWYDSLYTWPVVKPGGIVCFNMFITHFNTHRYLWDNLLSGTIPSSLGQLAALNEMCVITVFYYFTTHRDLSSNQLSGTIPSELGKFPNIHKMWFPIVYHTFYHSQVSWVQSVEWYHSLWTWSVVIY